MDEPVAYQDLHALALRMRRDLPCKERTIHLQTFKWTFHGHQAVAFLTAEAIAGDASAAVDLCQQMLQHGLLKSIYHKEQFTADSELYRFSGSLLDNKHKGLTSLTSTGLYKEIAKLSKAAAQPFKQVQVSLNDTFANLGSLSGVAPKLTSSIGVSNGNGATSGSNTPGISPSRLGRQPTRRLQHARSHSELSQPRLDHSHSSDGFAAAVSELQALQAVIKESSGLLRIDLQQHTALQEHIVGLLMAQQSHNQCLHALVSVIAAASVLLLAVSAAPTAWPVQVVAVALLVVVAVISIPSIMKLPWRVPQSFTAGILGRAAEQPTAGAVDACRTMSIPQGKSAPALDTASIQGTSAATEPGIATDVSFAVEQPADSDSVATDWEELGPALEDFEDWPDAPVMLCPDPAVKQQFFAYDNTGPCQALPLNSIPIPFESELFRGVVVVYIRHLSSTPSYIFKGKKRLMWVALQGTFKRPVSMDTLVFGQEFNHKLINLPAPWFIDNMLLPLARKISPALRVGNLEQPYLYSPLITASQIVNVALPGSEPPLMEAKEDVSLITGDLLSVSARRKHFQSAAARTSTSFTTEHVWTFHLWQEYVDYASYLLNLSYSSYDLTQHLDGQPLQVMVKDVSHSSYLVNLHVWHSNLVRSSQRHFTRRPTRMRSSRATATDSSAQGPAAGQLSEPLTPTWDALDGGAMDAASSMNNTLTASGKQEQNEQTLQQSQSPVAPVQGDVGSGSPTNQLSWLESGFTNGQQFGADGLATTQQQQQQQQQRAFSFTQGASGQDWSPSPGTIPQQAQLQQKVSSLHSSQLSAKQQFASAASTGSIPVAGQVKGLASKASSKLSVASTDGDVGSPGGNWMQLCSQLTSQTTDEELAERPGRSGISASVAASGGDSSKLLQSVRSL